MLSHFIGGISFAVSRIKNETGVSVRIPSDGENSNVIRIEGDPAGVKKAKQELLEMSQRMVRWSFLVYRPLSCGRKMCSKALCCLHG